MIADARIYPDIETSVYDGDTFDFLCRDWLNSYRFEEVRLYGVDTHELNSPNEERQEEAEEQRQFVVEWIKEGRERYGGDNRRFGPFPFEVRPIEMDSFGRTVAEVRRKSDNSSLALDLLKNFDGIEYGR